MSHAIELSSRESKRILETARATGRQVRVLPKTWSESRSILGSLVSASNPVLEVDIPGDAQSDLSESVTCYCQIDLDCPEGQYFFDTHIVAVRPKGKELRLSLAWPKTVLVLQRRSSGRTALAKPSTVQISREHKGKLISFEGRLYNLSPDGLAFKVAQDYADDIEIGQAWFICFEVPEQGHVYRLQSTVRRKLPLSTRGDAIIGVLFDGVAGEVTELNLLQQFLETRGNATANIGETSWSNS
jgi:hypothetical protein